MIIFNSQKIVQHLKNTIKKFSHSVSLWFLTGSREVFPSEEFFLDIWHLVLALQILVHKWKPEGFFFLV